MRGKCKKDREKRGKERLIKKREWQPSDMTLSRRVVDDRAKRKKKEKRKEIALRLPVAFYGKREKWKDKQMELEKKKFEKKR